MAGIYVAVTNIPPNFHAADLRSHFSSFIEEKSFICFHFRHRPEKPAAAQNNEDDRTNQKQSVGETNSESSTKSETLSRSADDTKTKTAENQNHLICLQSYQKERGARASAKSRLVDEATKCCIITVINSKCNQLIQRYHGQQWTDVDGQYLGSLCQLSIVPLKQNLKRHKHKQAEDGESGIISADSQAVDEKDLLSMPEMRPPEMMPNGNVGTPTLVFLDFIQKCLLPKSIINKLHLTFPSTSAKRLYSSVNFQYDSSEPVNQRRKTGASQIVSDEPSPDSTSHLQRKFSVQSKSNDSSKIFQGSFDSQHSSTDPLHVTHSDEVIESVSVKALSPNVELQVSNKDGLSLTLSTSSSSPLVPSSSADGKLTNLKPTTQSEMFTVTQVADGAVLTLAEKRPLTRKEKKQIEKAERRKTKALMDEEIEERLIRTEQIYQNDDDAEEWDRHEATEDDPSNQERNKERLYEEEIEQPWEKGGPGVVFYTDAIYWQAKEGDFDEQTTDDLDVDFSPYEGDGPGDKDIQDFLKIRQEKRFRNGYDQTDRYSIGLSKRPHFKAPKAPPGLDFPHQTNEGRQQQQRPTVIGQFERHTKGIGRKLMERQGWQDGLGLGASGSGMKEALRGEGQKPKIKKGLGFVERGPVQYGPSVLRNARVTKPPVRHLITTSNDDPKISDPKELLLQRSEATQLKHRQSFLDQHLNS